LPSQQETGFGKLLSQLWFKRALFLGSDVLAISLAHHLAESLTERWLGVSPVYLDPPRYYVFYVLSFLIVLYLFGGYRDPDSRRPERELELGFKGISFFFVVLAAANFLVPKPQNLSPYLVGCWYGNAILFVLGARFGLRGLYYALWRHGLARETTLLAGPTDRVTDLMRHLSVQKHLRYKVLGALLQSSVNPPDLEKKHGAPPILGLLEDWEEIVDRLPVRWLILSLSANELSQHSQAREIARRCQEKGIAVQVDFGLLSSCEFQYERDEFSGCFRFSSPAPWSRPLQMAGKAVMDRFIGAIGSVVVVALTPIVALLLRLEDPGPIFYRREFVDQDGTIRHYLKFRSMVEDADLQLQTNHVLRNQFEHKYKLEQDPRILRVGRIIRKYSIDEFPQFFSLLTGRLSFVGPRVISSEERSRYGSLLPRLLSVKPGLTGYWQVMGRQTTSYDERIQMDMFYIEHWSIWLDLVIAAKTFWKVLWADGAY
jgi:exopolysaccharide biosynthesis polyprenyl glycosylphosphotransferase